MSEYKGITYSKTGYLNEEFRLFHLKDKKNLSFEFHYHDFNKIIIFISGDVTYLIEGKAYKLQPWDVLLVRSNEIHKPIINPNGIYERMVIWINNTFLDKHSKEDCNLSTCFKLAEENNRNLLHLDIENLDKFKYTISLLGEACESHQFGNHILKNSLFLQLLVYINNISINYEVLSETDNVVFDHSINLIIDYINENLNSDLSVKTIAAQFYMSKYHLMHKFKKQTGYTLHNYILQKRLGNARLLIKNGVPAMLASAENGFNDYSNFVRAFKKMFGLSPKKYYLDILKMQSLYERNRHF